MELTIIVLIKHLEKLMANLSFYFFEIIVHYVGPEILCDLSSTVGHKELSGGFFPKKQVKKVKWKIKDFDQILRYFFPESFDG